MKNKFAIVLIFILTMCLVSCREEDQPVYEIKSDFTVSNHIKSDYLYQQSSTLLITGECEVGGTIIASLYSHVGAEVSKSSVVVDNSGKYEIILNTPTGSFTEYTLEVRDYHNKYVKKYENILFGEVHLLLGDYLINSNFTVVSEQKEENDYFYFLDYTNPTNKFVTVNYDSTDDSFVSNLYQILSSTNKYNKMPIGFVSLVFEKTLLEEWLPLDYAKKSSSVVSFLESTGKYYENPHHVGQMSYVVNNLLSNLYNYSFNDITLSLGVNEFNDFYGKYDSSNFYNAYAKMLLNVLRNIENRFYNYNELSLIQANSNSVNNINELRNIQSQVSNYFSELLLIPTYDLENTETNTFNNLVANRYYDIVYGKKVISEYANHFIDENEHIVTIELSKSTLFEFNFDNLKIYDENGNLLTLDEDKIKGRFNQIIIDLSYDVIIDEEQTSEEVNFYSISKIEYAQDDIVEGNVIYNTNDLPLIPFVILFE